jgi:hypothetical protein
VICKYCTVGLTKAYFVKSGIRTLVADKVIVMLGVADAFVKLWLMINLKGL